VLDIAQKGWKEACNGDPSLQKGLSLDHGEVICKEILKEMLV
jgi:alanine dehydrogenase